MQYFYTENFCVMQYCVGILLALNKITVTIALLPPPLPSLACHYLVTILSLSCVTANKHEPPIILRARRADDLLSKLVRHNA